MARRIAAGGARVVAFDASEAFIARARERTPADAGIEYHVADASRPDALLAFGANRFDKAVCTMAIMDMPEIEPLFATLPRLLIPGGTFVFSVLHPCFLSAPNVRVAEIEDDQTGRGVVRSAVKVSGYLTPSARRTEGISGQPEPHWCFHRPLSTLFALGFAAGFVIDGLEEPRLPDPPAGSGLSWRDLPDIPPILAVRMRRGLASDTMGPSRPAATMTAPSAPATLASLRRLLLGLLLVRARRHGHRPAAARPLRGRLAADPAGDRRHRGACRHRRRRRPAGAAGRGGAVVPGDDAAR